MTRATGHVEFLAVGAENMFDRCTYGPAVERVLEGAPLNELGPGTPHESMRAPLALLTPESLAAPRKLIDREMAMACLAGLWLRWDFLDESHRISQEQQTATGSFWHAIMHRREGDFDNAKYWFRRVGNHAVLGALGTAIRELPVEGETGAAALLDGEAFDPFRFVDWCRQALGDSSPLRGPCLKIQQLEWELLFDDCYRRALEP